MLSINELRKIDPSLYDLSDEDLKEVAADLYALGELAFDVWWEEKNGSKNPFGLLTSDSKKDSI